MDSSSTSSSSPSVPPLPLPKSPHHKPHKRTSTTHRHSSDTRSSSDRPSHSKRRSKDGSLSTSRELVRLLAFEGREVKELQRMLLNITEQLKYEKQRADDSDRKALDAAHRYRNAENLRVLAEQNTARANEELRLYKIQLENAQKEIFRAQEVLSTVDQQRHDAEEDAARSRSTARVLKEEKLMQLAREEGRRMGVEEGMERGRDLGYQEGRAHGYEQGRSRAEHVMERFLYDADMHMHGDEYGNEYDHHDDQVSFDSPPIAQTPLRAKTSMHSVPPTPRRGAVPPDNWIPEQDVDAVIRLPPPHEMNRPPISRSPSPPLPPLPDIREEDEDDQDEGVSESPLMIPAPMPQPDPNYAHDTSRRTMRVPRRSSSPGSEASTRISELDLVTAPHQYMTRGFSGERLSVIPEATNSESTPSQRTMRTASTPMVHRQASMRESVQMPTPRITERQPNLRESVHMPTPRVTAEAPEMRTTDYYRRPRSPSEESAHNQRRSSIVNKPTHNGNIRRSRSTSSLGSVPDINIEPPTSSSGRQSRPQSNNSRDATREVPNAGPSFLSPQDANRPSPLPPTSRARGRTAQPPPPIINSAGVGTPAVLAGGPLPPGFVPTGPSMPEAPGSRSSKRNSASAPAQDAPSTRSSRAYQSGAPIPETPGSRTSRTYPAGPPIPDNSGARSSKAYPAGPSVPNTPRSRSNGIYGPTPPVPSTPVSRFNGIYASGPPPPNSLPGGFPAMNDQYMSLSSQGAPYRELDEDPMPATMPVIPPPSANYPDSDDDAESTSTGSSANTLSTPPPRRQKSNRRSDYPSAPIPPGVLYPQAPESALPVPPPGSGGGVTPRTSYPRGNVGATPGTSSRPLSIYGDQNNSAQGLKPSASKHSLRSSKSHKHFDSSAYLDPAFLASSSAEDVNNVGMGRSSRG